MSETSLCDKNKRIMCRFWKDRQKITDINDSDKLIQELDSLCKKYKKEEKVSDKNED